jgi:hypothetical protein
MRTTTSALLLLCALVASAHAHDARSPLAVAVDLDRTRVAAYLRYTVERGEDARTLREQFDRDADGGLDDQERTRLRDFLVERARAAFAASVDGKPLAFEVRQVAEEIGPGDDARLVATVRLVARVKWSKSVSLTVAVELAKAVTPVALRVGKDSGLALAEGVAGGVASAGAPLAVRVSTARR